MLAACLRAPSEELGAHLNKLAEMDFVPGHSHQCLFAARASARAGLLVGKVICSHVLGSKSRKRMLNPPRELGCFMEPSLFPFSGQYQHFHRGCKFTC